MAIYRKRQSPDSQWFTSRPGCWALTHESFTSATVTEILRPEDFDQLPELVCANPATWGLLAERCGFMYMRDAEEGTPQATLNHALAEAVRCGLYQNGVTSWENISAGVHEVAAQLRRESSRLDETALALAEQARAHRAVADALLAKLDEVKTLGGSLPRGEAAPFVPGHEETDDAAERFSLLDLD